MAAITSDVTAWDINPVHRWVYNRLLVASTQTYPAGHSASSLPTTFPAVEKPIVNLEGMARGVKIIQRREEAVLQPGIFRMWSALLKGRHVSTDMMVERGVVEWEAQAIGYRAEASVQFAFWTLLDIPSAQPERDITKEWVSRYLSDYSGPVNIETIGGAIIEVHLRLSPDWQQFYDRPTRAIGIPVWQDLDLDNLPSWAILAGEDERPQRQAYVVVRA